MKIYIKVYANKYIWEGEDYSIHILNKTSVMFYLKKYMNPTGVQLVMTKLDREGEVCLMSAA